MHEANELVMTDHQGNLETEMSAKGTYRKIFFCTHFCALFWHRTTGFPVVRSATGQVVLAADRPLVDKELESSVKHKFIEDQNHRLYNAELWPKPVGRKS
jgi:hypothetical protein